ncbi:MAG: hypothetical protein IJH60_03005 [Eubacterium sp.]|nr:hypothetical protein [Eubacterium sp.]
MKYRKILCCLLLTGSILFGACTFVRPPVVNAAFHKTVKKTSQRKKEKKYFTHAGFEWDNRYLETGKKIDLTGFVKGTTGLSKKTRAKLIKWKSCNPAVMTINRYGIAKPKKAGTCRIRCRMKTKRGWKKVSKTIKVFDSRNVSFRVTFSLRDGNRYAGKIKKSYNEVFDTVTIQVTNSGKKPVVLSKDLLLCEPKGSYVPTQDRYGVDVWMHCMDDSVLTVSPGEKKSVVYRTDGVLSYLKEDQKNNNTYCICTFTSEGTRKDLRYEVPTGKMTITR